MSYRETELNNLEFYERLDKSGEIPTSSQPSLDELYKAMEICISQCDEVLCIFLSSKMSGTFSRVHIIKNMILEKYPSGRIEIIDSATNSMQMGY